MEAREVLVKTGMKEVGRKRTLRAVGQSALVATVVAAVGLTSWAVVSNNRDPANPAIVSPTPVSPSPTVTVSPSPGPTESPAIPTDPDSDWGALSDDIPDDAYPAMAPNRGDGFPEAHIMEPWVWDKAGPNWALIIVTSAYESSTAGPLRDFPVDAYAYLVSPEGRHFELVEVAQRGLTHLASWHEESRTAHIVYEVLDAPGEYRTTGHVGLLDLETGAITESSVALDFGVSAKAYRILTNDSQNEWWWFTNGDFTEQILASWSESTGWVAIEESRIVGHVTDVPTASYQRDGVVVNLPSDDPGMGSAQALFVNLDTGDRYVRSVPYPLGKTSCVFSVPETIEWYRVDCTDGENREFLFFAQDGSQIEAPGWVEPTIVDETYGLEKWVDEATGLNVLLEPEEAGILEISTASGKLLASVPGELLPGLRLFEVEQMPTGLVRIGTDNAGVFVVDLERERLVAMTNVAADDGEVPNVRSIVFYGENSGWSSTGINFRKDMNYS